MTSKPPIKGAKYSDTKWEERLFTAAVALSVVAIAVGFYAQVIGFR